MGRETGEEKVLRFRSLLFVPGDRLEHFARAAASGADALILDLEDSLVAQRKGFARSAIIERLADTPEAPCFVRVNPLCTAAMPVVEDGAALRHGRLHAGPVARPIG